MLRLLLRVTPAVVGMVAVCVVGVRLGYGWTHPLQDGDVFRDGACGNPCWHGLEVGVTPRAAVEGALTADGSAADDNIYVVNTDAFEGYLLLGDTQTLTLMRLDYLTCPEAIFATYGVPNSIIADRRGPVYLFYGHAGVMVVYTDGRFTVQLSEGAPGARSRTFRHEIAWNVMLREMRPYCS